MPGLMRKLSLGGYCLAEFSTVWAERLKPVTVELLTFTWVFMSVGSVSRGRKLKKKDEEKQEKVALIGSVSSEVRF